MKKRIDFLDYARGIAIIGIVLAHSIGNYISVLNNNAISFFSGIFIHQMCLPAAAVFLFITGFFLSNVTIRNAVPVLKRRLIKIYIPYLIWIPLFFALIGSDGIKDIRGIMIKTLFFMHVYWYFFLLLIMILAAPFLSMIRLKHLKKIVFISLLFSIFFGLLGSLLFYVDFQPYRYYIDYFFLRNPAYWAFYFIFGYMIGRKDKMHNFITYTENKIVLIVLIAVFFCIIAAVEWFILAEIVRIKSDDIIFQSRLTSQLYCIFGGALLIIMMKRLEGTNFKIIKDLLRLLGQCSFQIYLLHPIIVFWGGPLLFSKYLSLNTQKVLYFVLGISLPILTFRVTRRISSKFSKVIWGY